MSSHPPDPQVVHPRPAAPHFVGRETELAELRRLWESGFRGVLALVGLGGAGKTAVASHFLHQLSVDAGAVQPRGLFVWSFYQEPDAGLFLQEAYRYFTQDEAAATPAQGAGLLHLLHEALSAGGPHLLVLDGLERVQRQEETGAFGQIEDPLLRGLLSRIAEGNTPATVLVTSRFPLTDLEAVPGRRYARLDVGGLEPAAARTLLRQRGVQGDEAALDELIDAYGAHALTLDHLGGVIGQFLGGDPRRAPEAPGLTEAGRDRQALRLARLLRAYEEHLPPAELALLCRLCVIRRSMTPERIEELFLCTPAVHARTVRELALALAGHLDFSLKGEDATDLADSVRQTMEELLCAGEIAGPQATLQRDILSIPAAITEVCGQNADIDYTPLVQFYSTSESPTDQLPLSAHDRDSLRVLYERWRELDRHPSMPQKTVAPQLKQAFERLGYHRKHLARAEEVLFEAVAASHVQVVLRLRYLALKHFALRRVRELCRTRQRKWSVAGPLATLDAAELRQALHSLAARHLVVFEADGSCSVHPAVRDHFGRLARAEQESWHDILREQMISLVQRPGVRLPEDRATLDLIEEAIHHALQAGKRQQAEDLFTQALGGLRHLAWKLGEMNRGLRILRSFDPCPDPSALAWFLRALGEYDEAFKHNTMAYFRADILLLQGRLPEVAREEDSARTATAAFLMGESKELPPDLLGCAVPRDQLQLLLGRLDRVQRIDVVEKLYESAGREGDRARCQLLLAEVARRQDHWYVCQQHRTAAARWILHSGSVEHLCLLHLTEARAHRQMEDRATAARAVSDGLHLARRCGLRLYLIDLLCELAEQHLAGLEATEAEAAAREALGQSLAADCRFLWGAAEAGHLLGQSLVQQRRVVAAGAALEEALNHRRRLGHPQVAQTEALLRQL